MINKIICILLLVLYIILIYLVFKEINKNKMVNNTENFQLYKTTDKNIEHFEDEKVDKWGESQDDIDAKLNGLNNKQKKEVGNMINVKVKAEVKENLGNQPNGGSSSTIAQTPEPGPSGPPGAEYIASGSLINKKYSIQDNNVKMSVTRLHGEEDAGKAYMEISDLFSPTNYWYLYKDGTLKNRLDNKCLTTSGTDKSDLYMSQCSEGTNQIWDWDKNSNRLVLKSSISSASSTQKCIGLSGPKVDANTQLAGCTNNSCGDKNKRFLQLNNCNSSVKPEEVWSFGN